MGFKFRENQDELIVKLSKEEMQLAFENNIGINDVKKWLSNNFWVDGDTIYDNEDKEKSTWKVRASVYWVQKELNLNDIEDINELEKRLSKLSYMEVQLKSLEKIK